MTKENKEQYFKTGEKCIKCGGTQYFIIPFENKELYKCCGCYRKMKKENPELHKKMMKRPDENNSKPWNEYPIEMLKKTILRDEMMKIVGKEKGKIMKKEIKKEAEEKNEDWCPNCKIHVLGKDIGFGGHHKKCDHPVIQTCDIDEYLKINFFDKIPVIPYKIPTKENPVKKVNSEKYPEFKCIESYFCREEINLDKHVNIALTKGWKILDIKIMQESDRDGSGPIFCAIMGLPVTKEK